MNYFFFWEIIYVKDDRLTHELNRLVFSSLQVLCVPQCLQVQCGLAFWGRDFKDNITISAAWSFRVFKRGGGVWVSGF